MKAYKDCRNSFFYSFSRIDNNRYGGWILDTFHKKIKQTTMGVIEPINEFYPSTEYVNDPIISGKLNDEIVTRIENSFAFIAVVGEAYIKQNFCDLELEYIKSKLDNSMAKNRVFLIAINDKAKNALIEKTKDSGFTVIPFFDDNKRRPTSMTNQELVDLAMDISEKIGESICRDQYDEPYMNDSCPDSTGLDEPYIIDSGPDSADANDNNTGNLKQKVVVYLDDKEKETTKALQKYIKTSCIDLYEEYTPSVRELDIGYIRNNKNRRRLKKSFNGIVLSGVGKDPEAVLEHINFFEDEFDAGIECFPGIVANLVPDKSSINEVPNSYGWNYFNFVFDKNAHSAGVITPFPKDANSSIASFIDDVIAHKKSQDDD